MTLNDIAAKFGKLRIYQERHTNDELIEFVIFNEDTEQWFKLFENNLGTPTKPAGEKPDEEDMRVSKNYGGIARNQILFRKAFDDYTIVTMFWPWGDGMHTTIKVFQIDDQGSKEKSQNSLLNSLFNFNK